MKILLKQYQGFTNLTLIIIFSFTLVFSNNLNSYCLFAIFFFNIYVFWDKDFILLIIKDKYYQLFATYFFMLIVSFFYSDNSQQSFIAIEKSASFLFLPIGIGFMMKEQRVYHWFLNSFIWALTGLLIFAYVVAFSKNLIYNISNNIEITKLKSWFFTYHYLAENVNISAIYFSLYISFAGVILLYSMFIKDVLNNKWIKKFRYPIMFILNIGLMFLSARTILVIYILMALIIIGIYFYRKRRFSMFIIGALGSFFILGILICLNDVLFLRFKGIFTPFEETKYFSGGLYSRIFQWKAVFTEYCQHNLIMGFGTGDAQEFYNHAYIQTGLPWAEIGSFNIHNMYLESLFSTGILGVTILLLIFFSSIYKGIKFKNIPYLLFLILFMFAGLTESLLNRQYGIVFFLFVNFIFYFHLNEGYNKNSSTRNARNT